MPLDETHETGLVMLSQLTANTVQNLPSNNFSAQHNQCIFTSYMNF